MSGLDGKRIVVTRAASQAESLCRLLTERNACPLVFPTVKVMPLVNSTALRNAFADWTRFDWVIFTSVNGVHVFFEEAITQGLELCQSGGKPSIAAVGPATAQALGEHGQVVTLAPDEFVAERVAEALGDVRGLKILLPRARKARTILPTQLTMGGAIVTEIATYDTVHPSPADTPPDVLDGPVDAVTFTSSSTVEGFLRLVGPQAVSVLETCCVACIGPVTAETARRYGIRVDTVAADYTIPGLVEALCGYFAGR